MRQDGYSAGTSVRVQTVPVALHAVGSTCELERRPNPCYQPGTTNYHRPLAQMLEDFRRVDPPPVQKLAAPVAIIHTIARLAAAKPTPRKCLIANLCTVAFYFLLRSIEYSDTGKQNTRTTPFRLGDITFWCGNECVNAATIPNPHLLSKATAATLRITNQKNTSAKLPPNSTCRSSASTKNSSAATHSALAEPWPSTLEE